MARAAIGSGEATGFPASHQGGRGLCFLRERELGLLITARDHALAQMNYAERCGWSAYTAASWFKEAQCLERFLNASSILPAARSGAEE